VLAHCLGNIVQWATINGQGGKCCYLARGRKVDPMREGIISLAGHAAAMKWHRWPQYLYPYEDHQAVLKMGFRNRSVNTLLMHARGMVEALAPAIDGVAKELVAAGRIEGKAIRRIIRATGCANV
jgi:hypothetical protein